MQLTPRYDAAPIIVLDTDSYDVGAAMLRQRRRLEELVGSFDDLQWAHATRCAGWSVREVVQHLTDVNSFWAFSIKSGRAGAPTQLLATMDPQTTPAQLVAAAGDLSYADTLERYVTSNDRLTRAIDGLDAAGWEAIGEAPPGHLALRALAHHALWDGWIHERDIALPQGLTAPTEDDELLACLRYVAALSPAFGLSTHPTRRGSLVVTATDLAATFRVIVEESVHVTTGAGETLASDVVLEGSAVELIEMLSTRAPLAVETSAEQRWIVGGLATVFDQ